MALRIDPMGLETRAIHELIDFGGKAVLEIGCGDGRVTWRYAPQAAKVTAFDPDEGMIEAARNTCPDALRSTVSFRVADVRLIDLPDGAYDVVVFSGSL